MEANKQPLAYWGQLIIDAKVKMLKTESKNGFSCHTPVNIFTNLNIKAAATDIS